MYGGLHAYQVSIDLTNSDPPMSALLMAAMRKADSQNAAILHGAYPQLWAEMQRRYNAPGGRLEDEL